MRRRGITIALLALSALFTLPALAVAGDPKKPAPKPPVQKPPEHTPAKPVAKPEVKLGAEKLKPVSVGGELDAALSLVDSAGKTVTIKETRGKIVVLHFWSMGNPAYDKRLAALNDEYSKKGVAFYAIAANKGDIEDAKKLDEHAKKQGITFQILLDKGAGLADKLGVANNTHTIVLDAKGIVKYSGAVDDDPKGEKADKAAPLLKNALESVIAGKNVAGATNAVAGTPITRK